MLSSSNERQMSTMSPADALAIRGIICPAVLLISVALAFLDTTKYVRDDGRSARSIE